MKAMPPGTVASSPCASANDAVLIETVFRIEIHVSHRKQSSAKSSTRNSGHAVSQQRRPCNAPSSDGANERRKGLLNGEMRAEGVDTRNGRNVAFRPKRQLFEPFFRERPGAGELHMNKHTILRALLFVTAVALAAAVFPANAQDKAAITQELTSKYALTKTTADRTDIVTAGAILVLKKDGLLMVDVSSSNLYQNTYKDGKITQNALGKISRFHFPGAPSAPTSGAAQRTFVAGEKMWVTNITVKDNGVDMELYTDAINDIRYRAVLNFPFKGSDPIGQQADKLVADVFDVQPADNSDSGGGQQQQAAAGGQQQAPAGDQQQANQNAPASADAALAPIPPPPPPADAPPAAPKTIALGQTKDLVVANFGQPQKIVKLATKEIYYYPDMKVTFVKDKVTDVQ